MRYVLFVIAIALGLGLGLFYGWVVSPVELIDTAPNTLREDYRADYVLMVAEAYTVDGDLELAVRRLAMLGDQHPIEIISEAGVFGAQIGYTFDDLQTMRDLADALRGWNPNFPPTSTLIPVTPTENLTPEVSEAAP
jgi:hypothetical protein